MRDAILNWLHPERLDLLIEVRALGFRVEWLEKRVDGLEEGL